MKGEMLFALIDRTAEDSAKLAELHDLTERILNLSRAKAKYVEKSEEEEEVEDSEALG